LCLFTYSPEDPSLSSFSTSGKIRNSAGIVGAYLSDLLIQVFGIGAYLLPFISLLYGWREFKGSSDDRLSRRRAIGITILFLSVLSILQLHFQTLDILKIGPIPPGGIIGRALSYLFSNLFGAIGAYLIIIALILSSLVLSINLPIKVLAKEIKRYTERGFILLLMHGNGC